ncbi:HIT family protein [Vibrio sp. JC009]|uniref:HIT domain-containing protein n=1 Tax=Vibrio sp. JC009 TaxID=2912314 RepID=UPI0023B1A41F|nr:HIT family protein [Vibrio sp. JC009]WED20917.1 HIT family protein [Vibrio sp. JC009]
MAFTLHPRLENDTTKLGELPLCTVLLAKDNCVPWIILVPKVDGLRELHHLPMDKQQQFLFESQLISQTLEALFKPDKINLGALGNMVSQLHIHHIARFISDAAWPGPVWGNTAGVTRSQDEQQALADKIRKELSRDPSFQLPQN